MVLKGVGLIGCGAMGSAMARGFAKVGGVDPADIRIHDMNKERMNALAGELGVQSVDDLAELTCYCRHIFIAVKPQDIERLLQSIRKLIKPQHLVTSIAAGISIKMLEDNLPEGSKVIRLMPNTPCLVGEGATAISTGQTVTAEERTEIVQLLEPLGLIIPVPDRLMNGVTGLSGTGPAYVFLFVETLIDAGVNVGLNRDVATSLVVQTVIGAARMLKENGKHPVQLRNEVTSPAGTTCAALRVLEEEGFRSCLIKAVMEATSCSGALSGG